MNKELQNKLYDKYPELFSNKDKTIKESCMAFGIETGDGWYDILSNLCFEIKQHEENVKNQNSSRYNKDYVFTKFDQIKEKFGGLRAYYSGGDDFIRGLVSMAEAISYSVCENCGNKGQSNKSGWIAVLCEKCSNERK